MGDSKESKKTRGGGEKGGKGGSKGGHPRMRKWEVERRKRRMRKVAPVVILVLSLVGVVAGVSVFAPELVGNNGPTGSGPCDYPRTALRHYHASLSIYRDNQVQNIPGNIGIDPALTADNSMVACTSGDPAHGASPVHTHAGEANLLHVETIVDRDYTLGDFFRTWGQPIGPDQVWNLRADANHRLVMSVDGQPSLEWGNLVLSRDYTMQIRIDYITV